MKNGRWQAKDIEDGFFLACIEWASNEKCPPGSSVEAWAVPHWVHRWNLEPLMPLFPPDVILAKARAMLKRGLLSELTEQGRAFLARWHNAA